MKVLVTGGLGYIGSHTAVELSKKFKTIIVDNLINSNISVINGINKISKSKVEFEKIDLTISKDVKNLFDKYPDIDGIIHFAALKSVGESVDDPVSYYHNNIVSLLNILKEIKVRKMSINFIFSSSCTVYGQSDNLPITENEEIKTALSPYGNTKQICEEILSDYSKIASNFNVTSLRYFNPIGAHESAEIGELPLETPQNLIPFITQSVAGVRGELTVFGDDYDTHDGTCIRDYIHVVDLAEAHICALNYLIKNKGIDNEVFNIGTGKGNSVLEVIREFENVTGLRIKYKIGKRRKGDITSAFANNSKAIDKLSWKPNYSLADALLSAWKWEKKIRKI